MWALLLVVTVMLGRRLSANELAIFNAETGIDITVTLHYTSGVCREDTRIIPHNRSLIPWMGFCQISYITIKAPGRNTLTFDNAGANIDTDIYLKITLDEHAQFKMTRYTINDRVELQDLRKKYPSI